MIHHVFANCSTIGDWLSARGIQHLLRPLTVKEHFCDEPFVSQPLQELGSLDDGSCVVIGGGGLFMDYFAPLWEGIRALGSRFNYCLWGIGYCDLKAEASHPPVGVLLDVVRGSRLCVVRDDLTRRYLGSCALLAPVVRPSVVVVDYVPSGWGVLHVDNYTTVGASAYEAMDVICRAFAARTGRPYRKTNNRLALGGERELAEVLKRYECSDLIVSSALHGCIIATAMGRPVLAVSGDRKIEAFMEAAGLGEWVLNAADLERLPTLIEVLDRQVPIREFGMRARALNAVVADTVKRIAIETAGVRRGS